MTAQRTPSTLAKGEKLAWRLAHIIASLHQGDAVNKYQLAEQFNVDVRTIERDLGERLKKIAERNASGDWQLTLAARGTIPARHLNDYAHLIGAQNLFPNTSLRFLLEQLQIPTHSHPLLTYPIPNEDLRPQTQTFENLQAAVQKQNECRFDYKGKARLAQPYRLIHKNGIWYLSAVGGKKKKNFSVSLITALQVDEASSFAPDPAHHNYINIKDDVWFTSESTEVLLRVAPAAAHYFIRRALLPQQHCRSDGDGSLLVSAQINHLNQLLPVVRYWLPNVRIVRPLEWHETLVSELRHALAHWEQ